MDKEASYEYASSTTTPMLARHDLAPFLDGALSDERIESAILMIDELVTNAVVHVGGTVEVRASLEGSRLHVEVVDDSPELPQLRRPAVGGRGLRIVDTLASAWGVRLVEDNGKAVWFDLC